MEVTSRLSPERLTVSDLVSEAHATSVRNGFWIEGDASDAIKLASAIALIHSELSEALEELRKPDSEWSTIGHNETYIKGQKPEGFVVELADAVIRIADLCGALNLNLSRAIEEKLIYNRGRPHKHGKRF